MEPPSSPPSEEALSLGSIFGDPTAKVEVAERPRTSVSREDLAEIDKILANLIEINGLNDVWLTPGELIRVRVFGKVSTIETVPAIKLADFEEWIKRIGRADV